VISSIGFGSREVDVDNQSSLTINMVPEVKSLEDIVVVGYGERRKRDLTGALSSVRSKKQS